MSKLNEAIIGIVMMAQVFAVCASGMNVFFGQVDFGIYFLVLAVFLKMSFHELLEEE